MFVLYCLAVAAFPLYCLFLVFRALLAVRRDRAAELRRDERHERAQRRAADREKSRALHAEFMAAVDKTEALLAMAETSPEAQGESQ